MVKCNSLQRKDEDKGRKLEEGSGNGEPNERFEASNQESRNKNIFITKELKKIII